MFNAFLIIDHIKGNKELNQETGKNLYFTHTFEITFIPIPPKIRTSCSVAEAKLTKLHKK